MKKFFIISTLVVALVFAGCTAEQSKSAQGKFSAKPVTVVPVTLNISQGSTVGATDSIKYGTEVALLSFNLSSSDGSTISVSTASFTLSQKGLVSPVYGTAAGYKIYPVISGSIDTSQVVANSAQLLDDGVTNTIDGVLIFSLHDPSLGSRYALQVSNSQEYVIVGPVQDDGTTNTNSISVASVNSSNVSLAEWAWSKKASALITATGTFSNSKVVGSAGSTSI